MSNGVTETVLANFPRATLAHLPTPFHKLPQLSAAMNCNLYIKRDDCTGVALGGNKARQLEFYLGDALAQGCDTVLSTGAVQSNYMRMLAASAAQLGLECHIQLESRVDTDSDDYHHSGNVLLNRLLGANLHYYPSGEDEAGADRALKNLADELTAAGKKPYIIPLGATHSPLGALGYVAAAAELLEQMHRENIAAADSIIAVGSGSGITHAGLLVGLKLLGAPIPVLGVCVRRNADLQHARILQISQNVLKLLNQKTSVTTTDIQTHDAALSPGYGSASQKVLADLKLLATHEGILTDPVYSAKTFSGVFELLRTGKLTDYKNIIVIHTGGTPALFAYRKEIAAQ